MSLKLFGIEAEINITADEELSKAIGEGIKKGTISVAEIAKELKPQIVEAIKKAINN